MLHRRDFNLFCRKWVWVVSLRSLSIAQIHSDICRQALDYTDAPSLTRPEYFGGSMSTMVGAEIPTFKQMPMLIDISGCREWEPQKSVCMLGVEEAQHGKDLHVLALADCYILLTT